MQKRNRWLALILACTAGTLPATPLDAAFTYQGQLTDQGSPANGSYDLQFTLFDAGSGDSLVAGPVTFSTVTRTNGNFTAELDFGEGVFTGEVRWLEIGVRTNGSPEDFTVLSPRQEIMPTPYALYTPSAGTAASAGSVSGTIAAI